MVPTVAESQLTFELTVKLQPICDDAENVPEPPSQATGPFEGNRVYEQLLPVWVIVKVPPAKIVPVRVVIPV